LLPDSRNPEHEKYYAVHEAGHCIFALRLGVSVEGLALIGKGAGIAGKCYTRSGAIGDIRRFTPFSTAGFHLSGMVATSIFCRTPSLDGCHDDADRALKALPIRERSRETLKRVWEEVERLVNIAATPLLADELLKRRTLSDG
jgi:hypothetical protein